MKNIARRNGPLARWAPVLGLVVAAGLTTAARAEPPIRNAQDAMCREQARVKVFSTPDPRGLGPYAIGRRIYASCMQRAGRPAGKAARRRG